MTIAAISVLFIFVLLKKWLKIYDLRFQRENIHQHYYTPIHCQDKKLAYLRWIRRPHALLRKNALQSGD
jgi:hypothetical protein